MKPKEIPVPLFRVYLAETGRPAYLPATGSLGLPLEEAERLSALLAAPTEVRQVWSPPEEDA